MMYMLKCIEKNITLSEKLKIADNFFNRLIGLMFSKDMKSFDALMFSPGTSIHTCFMRYNLDIIFIDRKNRIIKVVRDMKPWRMTGLYFKAVAAIEFKGGTLSPDIKINDVLFLEECQCLS